tara:strand:+ start:2212 stop:2718 length:507 start_codon:yes stop_codon:yes gene_type:complete
MKTLVIHPEDSTTDFLKVIYQDKDWTVITDNISKSKLKQSIRDHDRIVMLGHGTEYGLIGYKEKSLIDSSWVWLLREKETVCIWCNADVFVEKYGLKGLYTGMIISEWIEANLYCVNASNDEIEESNILFAESVRQGIDEKDPDQVIKKLYEGSSYVIKFNRDNIYKS